MHWTQQLIAFGQIVLIDIVLAGDNAIVVGMAASRVVPSMRLKVIIYGVAGAVLLRILFAVFATQLLTIVGLTLAGGILLLWVCWKMYRELLPATPEPSLAAAGHGAISGEPKPMSFWSALRQIIIADVSMSLDNVLAVAGTAKGDLWVLVPGLALAVVLMGAASNYIANMLSRNPWITWVGLLIIFYVAADMIWDGSHEVGCTLVPQSVCAQGLLEVIRSAI